MLSCSVISDSLQPHGLQPARLLCPWDSPGKNTGVGSLSLLQGIFPTQELNQGLLHCRQILYQLSYQGRPIILYVVVIFMCLWEEVSLGSFQSTILSHGSMKGFLLQKEDMRTLFFFMSLYLVLCLELLNEFSYLKKDEANTEKD